MWPCPLWFMATSSLGLSWLICEQHHRLPELRPRLDGAAGWLVPESALWGPVVLLAGAVWLVAGCPCLLDSWCRLVSNTKAWLPVVWPLPEGP